MYTYRILCCFSLRYRPASNEPSEDLKQVFKRYSSDNGVMGLQELQRFMSEVQGEANAVEAAQSILDKSRDFILLKKKGFSLDAFFRYLSSDENSPLSPGVSLEISSLFP
jgi:Phosphoinositide-specific phospholipase C, efhand-like